MDVLIWTCATVLEISVSIERPRLPWKICGFGCQTNVAKSVEEWEPFSAANTAILIRPSPCLGIKMLTVEMLTCLVGVAISAVALPLLICRHVAQFGRSASRCDERDLPDVWRSRS